MELSTCARPYAKAAFAFANSSQALDSWSEMLQTGAAVALNEKVHTLLSSPALTASQKAEAFISVCGESIDDQARNFIHVLADNKRIALLPQIAVLFEALKAEQKQSVEGEVVSAFPLTQQQIENLTEKLRKKLNAEVRLNNVVDSRVLGGAVIRVGDLVIDGSVQTRLAKLADAMLS